MRQRLTLLGGVLAAIVVAAGVWLGFVYSGIYDVSASGERNAFAEWSLETISDRSIARHAQALPAPLPTDSAELLEGFEHYRLMCEVCHGGVGIDRSEISEGLDPRPPLLSRAARKWSDEELFWIVKHGIRSTGMPSFGRTHSDEALLPIVAIVRALPDMSAEEYAARIAASEAAELEHAELMDGDDAHHDAEPHSHTHTHPPGTPPHAD